MNGLSRSLLVICITSCAVQLILIISAAESPYGSARGAMAMPLVVSGAITFAGYLLGSNRYNVTAAIVMMILVLPSLFYGIFLLALLGAGGWR